ncbi:MAG TPA: N-acyl homoserine lactonase family protein [Gammaproteobacteria bacterium]|jgi:glyoxylase-like metal-dependent hydrolase (beta-lactamase superfamily II)
MTAEQYEVLAIKYAELPREARSNFVDGDPHETHAMPLDYFVWVVRNDQRTIVVDTGFGEDVAAQRGRKITNTVAQGFAACEVDPDNVSDVVISHLHYDHCGNDELFGNARYHLQDDEMAYATGRHMCHGAIAHAFEADDVARMVHRVFAGRVEFHDGDDTLAPGVTLHRLGGHTMGLQVVRVETGAGPVVLASDASHFYAHFENSRVFPVVYNVADVLEGYRTLFRLAGPGRRIIPGHDPLVLERYPAASEATAGWAARLDLNHD